LYHWIEFRQLSTLIRKHAVKYATNKVYS